MELPLANGRVEILPAIAAGNTIVLKPSELTPTTSVAFAEAAQRAGLPDGVINVVSGTGPVAGEALVTHRDVRMVSFTGSTRAGSRVGSLAAGLVKRNPRLASESRAAAGRYGCAPALIQFLIVSS